METGILWLEEDELAGETVEDLRRSSAESARRAGV
jgi:hypothetical protein